MFLRSSIQSLAKGVSRSFATKVIHMFSCFHFYIFSLPKIVLLSSITISEFALNLAIPKQVRHTVDIETVKEKEP